MYTALQDGKPPFPVERGWGFFSFLAMAFPAMKGMVFSQFSLRRGRNLTVLSE